MSKQVITDMTKQTLTWRENNAIWLQGARSKTWTNDAAATSADTWIGFTTSLYVPWRFICNQL